MLTRASTVSYLLIDAGQDIDRRSLSPVLPSLYGCWPGKSIWLTTRSKPLLASLLWLDPESRS